VPRPPIRSGQDFEFLEPEPLDPCRTACRLVIDGLRQRTDRHSIRTRGERRANLPRGQASMSCCNGRGGGWLRLSPVIGFPGEKPPKPRFPVPDRSCALNWKQRYAIPGVTGVGLHQVYRAMAWLGKRLPEDEQGHATPFAPRCTKDAVEGARNGDGARIENLEN
jgi:hypothetical protein